MTSLRPFGLQLLLLLTPVLQQPKESSAEKPSEQVEAVSGWTASLPCRVRNVDTPLLVLWYRQGQAHPFYSFDARGGNLSAGEGGVHDIDFGPRSSFELSGGLHLPNYSLDLGRKVGLSRTRTHPAWERQPDKKRRRRKRRWSENRDLKGKEKGKGDEDEEKLEEEAKEDVPVATKPKEMVQKREYYQEPRASNEVGSAGDAEVKRDSKEDGREHRAKGETKSERAKLIERGTEGEDEEQEGQAPREEVEEDIVGDFKSLPIFPGTLYIRNVGMKDAGGFHCRVDFLNSPTRNHRLNLTVYEPPRRISVVDGHGQNLQGQGSAPATGLVLGPLDEGASLLVVCNVFGGSPAPSIQWLKNGKVIRDDVSRSGGDDKWSNTLFVHHLDPEDQESTFSCRVSNNNIMQPNITNVTLDMNIKPSSVRISGISGPIDAGSRAEVTCTTSGSRPQATITWTLSGDPEWEPIRNTQSHTMKGETVSSVAWQVRARHDQARLTCIATNPRNPRYQRSNHTTLTVHHAPEANLFLGRGLDPKTIKEGVDVYFDCHVKANPPPTSTVFFHQGVEVTKKSFPEAILSGFSLALQKVTPSMAGEYSCKATNAKGSSTSKVVSLEVMYKPVCRTPKQIVSASLGHNVTVDCAVDAFPPPSRFAWSLNDTAKGLVALPQTQFETRGDTSHLHYTMPQKNTKVVEIFCWAVNALGNQQEPCTIKVFAPGKPKQVQGCTMEQRKQSLVVSCRPGVKGAVDQTYQAQLRLSDSEDVIANVTSRVPSFSFDVPEKGLEYVVHVYTLNVRYRSPPVVLEVSSLKVAENRMNSGDPDGSEGASPLLALFVGVVAAFLLTLAVILAATKFRCSAAAAVGAAKTGRSGGASGEAGGSIVGLEDNCNSDDEDDAGRDETSLGRDGQTLPLQVEVQPGSHSKESVGASSQDRLLHSTSSSFGIQQKDPLLSRDALGQAEDATVYKNVSYDEGHTNGYSVLGSSGHALGSLFASSSSSQFGVAYSGETVGLLSPSSSSRSHLTERRGVSMGPTPLLYGTLGQPRTLLPQHHTHSLGRRQSRLLQETGARSDFVGTNNRRLQSSASFITPHPDVSSTAFLPSGVRVPSGTGPSTMEVTVRGLTSLSPVGGSSIGRGAGGGGGGGGGSGGEVGLAATGASGTASSPSCSSPSSSFPQYRGWSEGSVGMTGAQLTNRQGANSRYHTLSSASAAASTTTTTTVSVRRANESFV